MLWIRGLEAIVEEVNVFIGLRCAAAILAWAKQTWMYAAASRFTKPSGPIKPPTSGSGLPDRFDQKSVETGWIQIQIQKHMYNRFRPVYRPVWPVYRSGLTGYRCFNQKIWRFKSSFPVWPVCRLPYAVGLNGPAHFFLFLFWFNFICPQTILNGWIFEKIWHH